MPTALNIVHGKVFHDFIFLGIGTRFASRFIVTGLLVKKVTMKKRSEARLRKSLLVDISKNGLEQMGVTVNISRGGMCIATTEIFRRRSKLQILLAAADDIYTITGTVVWNMKREMLPGDNVPAGMGIRIKDATPGYYKFIAAIKKNPFPLLKSRPTC
jgi:hypothetical protein